MVANSTAKNLQPKANNSQSINKTKLVGILNLTPDSFSDGGQFFKPKTALIQLQKMLEDGAEIIDIGAESTRPNATILTAEQEWQRLATILPQIIYQIEKFNQKNQCQIKASLDSYHFENLVKACEIGISIVNDVSGLTNPRIIEFIAKKELTAVLMHNLAIHANPSLIINPNLNVNREIINWAQEKVEFLQKFGIKKSQLIFDPGIGFSKNAAQNLQILKNIESYRILGLPLYVGHSKKSCLDELKLDEKSWGEFKIKDEKLLMADKGLKTKDNNDLKNDNSKQTQDLSNLKLNRAYKTLLVSKFLISKKVDFLRVHDVKAHRKLLC